MNRKCSLNLPEIYPIFCSLGIILKTIKCCRILQKYWNRCKRNVLLFFTLVTDFFGNYTFKFNINKVIYFYIGKSNLQEWLFPKNKIISVCMKKYCAITFVYFVFLIQIQTSVTLLFQVSKSGWLELCFSLARVNNYLKFS